jgi:hypothetical protein
MLCKCEFEKDKLHFFKWKKEISISGNSVSVTAMPVTIKEESPGSYVIDCEGKNLTEVAAADDITSIDQVSISAILKFGRRCFFRQTIFYHRTMDKNYR